MLNPESNTPAWVRCPDCEGGDENCLHCMGAGSVPPNIKTCDKCGGKGFVVDRGYERICGCGGTGYEPV